MKILKSFLTLPPESAANDGLAYPFLSISLYLTLEPDRREDIKDWVLVGWLCMSLPSRSPPKTNLYGDDRSGFSWNIHRCRHR